MFDGTYNATYAQLVDLEKHFIEHGIAVYHSRQGKSTNSTLSEARYHIYLASDGLHLTRGKEEPLDTDWKGLKPRTELVVKGRKLPKDKPFALDYQCRFIDTPGWNTNSIVLQIMDHEPMGGAIPMFQVVVRQGDFYIRYATLNDNHTRKALVYEKVTVAHPDLTVHIEGTLSSTQGHLKCLINGVLWEKRFPTATLNPDKVQIQFGLYSEQGLDLELVVKQLGYAPLTLVEEKDTTVPIQTPYGMLTLTLDKVTLRSLSFTFNS